MEFLQLPILILKNIDLLWTFVLLLLRFGALFSLLPGIGGGARGLAVRLPAMLAISVAVLSTSVRAAIPGDIGQLIGQVVAEILFGTALGMIPTIIISGAQMAGHLASTSMGLGAGNLLDPTLGMAVTDVSRLYGDLSVIVFLFLGGHHVLLLAAAGAGQAIVPGTFLVSQGTIDLIIAASAHIFEAGVMISAPIIVALLLTQFVMGLISRAVPTVNIFIVSFPLTIGIGLLLAIITLPGMFEYMGREISGIEGQASRIVAGVEVRAAASSVKAP